MLKVGPNTHISAVLITAIHTPVVRCCMVPLYRTILKWWAITLNSEFSALPIYTTSTSILRHCICTLSYCHTSSWQYYCSRCHQEREERDCVEDGGSPNVFSNSMLSEPHRQRRRAYSDTTCTHINCTRNIVILMSEEIIFSNRVEGFATCWFQ